MEEGVEPRPRELRPVEPLRDFAAERTPARILEGRSGAAYRTATWLKLRTDHAAARDAVFTDLPPEVELAELIERFGLVCGSTAAGEKSEYLRRPDLGRRLDEATRERYAQRIERSSDVLLAIGDGLSAAAVSAQVPRLFPLVWETAKAAGWKLATPCYLRHCRVGVMNELGELLDPRVVVLLIGERPGLATAESLSAYFAYKPRSGDTDAKRNLISNIHGRGVPIEEAAARIVALIALLMAAGASGVTVKEQRLTSVITRDGVPLGNQGAGRDQHE